MTLTIFTYAAAGAFLIWLVSCLYMVKQMHEVVITSFGKLVKIDKKPGLHLKQPWPLQAVDYSIDKNLDQISEDLKTKTKDDLFVTLPITILFRVSCTETYVFNNDNPKGNMKKLVSATVRTATSGKDFQDLYNDRDEISDAVITQIEDKVNAYGIEIDRIIIDEPMVGEETQQVFNQVRSSERLKEVAENEAAADYTRQVKKAEASAKAQELFGQGAANFRKKILDGYKEQIEGLMSAEVSKDEAIYIIMKSMELDALRDIGEKGNLIITPQELTKTGLAEVKTLETLMKKVA